MLTKCLNFVGKLLNCNHFIIIIIIIIIMMMMIIISYFQSQSVLERHLSLDIIHISEKIKNER